MIWKEVKTCANQSVRCGVITTQKSTFWKSFWTVRQYALPCIVHCDRVRRGVRVDEYCMLKHPAHELSRASLSSSGASVCLVPHGRDAPLDRCYEIKHWCLCTLWQFISITCLWGGRGGTRSAHHCGIKVSAHIWLHAWMLMLFIGGQQGLP